MSQSDTIYALSSGAPPSGVAVIRMSGPGVREALADICGGLPPARTAVLRSLRGADGTAIDRGLALFFPAPRSFSGEDCAELHLHGGRAVVAGALAELGRRTGFRMAEPGEFTRRAFVNGKIDLTEAEALADLVAAETEAQRRFALVNAQGGQKALYDGWRRRLLHARAMIEAELDFSDEGDVPGSVAETIWRDVAALSREMLTHAASYRFGEIVREGFKVVILGAPNAGKSTLLNSLAGREAAIVTEEPGTTRDLIELALDLDGIKVVLIDTAGIRADAGRVESIGIARAVEAAREADLVLYLEDAADPISVQQLDFSSLLRVGTKSDLLEAALGGDRYDLLVSARSGEGVDALLERIRKHAAEAAGMAGKGILPSRKRHQALVEHAGEALVEALDERVPLELRAEGLRRAADGIGRITGAIGTEELLGAIFSEFCIGK